MPHHLGLDDLGDKARRVFGGALDELLEHFA
jgi:hypothetical protein